MPETKRVVKFTIQQYRIPTVTEEEFHKYWSEKHAAPASPWLVCHGILKYAQETPPSATCPRLPAG
ncbi:hypothetical protein HOY82DRAFT_561867 [Tuber indicum]|nr:hypothetical protein HOY82DRAFT_561867 [Tuber indicum]